jgi:hypothetical protein
MEFYGSIDSVSGSITASLFTGSFKGDGGGLYNLAASGVTGLNLSQIASGNATASISSTGFTVNKSTQIQGDLSVTGSIIATNYIVSSSVTYMTTSFASGSSMFGNDDNDVHQFTGSVQITGSISLNGQAIGTGKLDETTFQSYTSSISSSIGSLSSSIALTDVSQSNRLTTIEGNYATTGSNLFKGSQTISGSIIPSVDNLYDLGSSTYQWRDVYISSGSLYIDGTKVLGSTSQELTITTDTGQSLKILEAGSDSIILQSTDGDIELKSSGGGDILFDPTNGIISIKGTTQIQDGFKITSSGGTNIVFGDTIIVSGSIDLTGNVDGIDLQSFSSSVSASISSLLGGNTSLSSSVATTTSGLSSSIGSLSSSIATTTSGLSSSIGSLSSSVATTTSGLSSSIESLSSSVATTTLNIKNRVDSIETTTGSLNTFTSSASGRLTSLETASGSIRTDFNTYTGSNNTTNTTQDGRLTSIEGITGSISLLNTYTGSNNTVIGTLQTSTSSLNSYTSSNTTNIDAIHISTGSFKSFTSSFDTAFGMSGADVTVKGNLTVSGTQTTVNSTTVAIGDNIIQLNGTGATNAGLVVRDATAPNTVSGSFLWDSTSDKWIAGALGSEDDVVLKTATQTLTNKTINASQLVDASVTNTKLANSSITIAGTSTSLGGTISAATILSGTGTVSGSSQIAHDSTTGYVANRHIDHTAVSISAGNGLSGGGDISTTRTISLDTTSATFTTGVKTKMNTDGVVSGSSQISFGGITGVPSGLVSGSSQITYGSLTGIPSGIVSGSSQITFGSISSIPSGLVSGSSQISLTSTTGFGTYLNQALLTTSTPTFSTVSATTFTGALSGNATTASSISGFNNPTAAATANTIAYRDGSGDLYARYFLGGYINTSDNVDTGTITHIMAKFGDNYHRSATAAKVQSFLGLGSLAYSSATIPTNNNQLTNGAGYITSDSTKLPLAGGTMTGTITITNTDIRSNASSDWTGDPGAQGKIQYHSNRWYIVADSSSNRIVQFRRNGTDVSYIDNSGNFIGNASTATTAGALSSMNISQFTNNSGYITSYSETDTLGSVTNRGSSTSQNIVFSNGRKGLVGVYDAAQTQAIFAMGIDYILTNGGASSTIGNHYGLAWSYNPDYGGAGNNPQSKAGLNHQLLHMQAGITTTAIGSGIWTSGGITCGTILPLSNNNYNLGSTGTRWANIYTNDLHLSNEGKEGGNEIDGTTGDWTIQEGEENLYIINHKNGKKFKIDLTEIV